ncbi:hypothetical protein [Mesorhizobium sp. AR02]|nr:hypothetical protein [Mesorhizobium sp. AR02]
MSLGIPSIGAMGIGVYQVPDREAVGRLLGRDCTDHALSLVGLADH